MSHSDFKFTGLIVDLIALRFGQFSIAEGHLRRLLVRLADGDANQESRAECTGICERFMLAYTQNRLVRTAT